MREKYWISGIVAAITYVFAVFLGGALWPGYSHLRQPISELTFRSAPNQAIVQPLFWFYNIALLVFAVGLFLSVKKRLPQTSGIMLALVAFAGIMMFFFPQDPIGIALTTSGLLHFIFAGVAAIGTLLGVLLFAIRLWKSRRWLSVFSLVIFAVILVSGPLTAVAINLVPEYFGVFERVTIGSFILWLFIISLKHEEVV